jgi:Pyruvate/2-oxoacid:ferredoxin oxidoreductase delta subunit
MEGDGPASGNPHHAGLLLASNDAVALDTVVAEIMGLDAAKVHTIMYSSEAGLGSCRMEDISVAGVPIRDVRLDDFKLPSNTGMELLPKFLVDLIGPFLWLRPRVDTAECIACGDCAKSCPTNAMRQDVEDTSPYLKQEACINCWCCHEICPAKAITVEKSWLAKRFIR